MQKCRCPFMDRHIHEGLWTGCPRFSGVAPAYLTFPYHRIYEHPCSECSLLVEREWQGEPIVLGAKIVGIEDKSLAQLDGHIERFLPILDDVWNISDFRQLLRMAGYPKWLRRFGMWQMLNWIGPRRARRAGTFMISSRKLRRRTNPSAVAVDDVFYLRAIPARRQSHAEDYLRSSRHGRTLRLCSSRRSEPEIEHSDSR